LRYVRKLYDWVLSWAESKYGELALFLLAFCETIFFPVPPDVLLIALALGSPVKSFRFALTCTIGSICGAIIGYGIGHYMWLNDAGGFTSFANFFFNNIPGFTYDLYYSIQSLYKEWDFWIVFVAGFTPIPYKVFTITSGVFDMNVLMFIIASSVSRGARFFLVSFLIWKFGPGIKTFIDRYFNLVALGFTVLLIGGFVIIKYLI